MSVISEYVFSRYSIFVILGIIMIWSSYKSHKDRQKLEKNLITGMTIALGNGMVGQIIHINHNIVWVRSGNQEFEVLKSSITEIVPAE